MSQGKKFEAWKEDELLEVIPFSPMPSSDELSVVASSAQISRARRHQANKKEPISSVRFLGKGASREVYTLKSDPENCVIKISRARSGTSHTGQMRCEIEAFLNIPRLRKWLPQIYSFDKCSLKWQITERCDVDKGRISKELREYVSKAANALAEALQENFGDNFAKHHFDEIVGMGNTSHDIKKGLEHLLRLEGEGFPLRLLSDVDAFIQEMGEEIIVALQGRRQPQKQNLNTKRSTRTTSKSDEDIFLESISNALRSSHPICVDLAIISIEEGLNFRDLHPGNIGFSRLKEAPYNLRLIDQGIIKARSKPTPNKEKLLRSSKGRKTARTIKKSFGETRKALRAKAIRRPQ